MRGSRCNTIPDPPQSLCPLPGKICGPHLFQPCRPRDQVLPLEKLHNQAVLVQWWDHRSKQWIGHPNPIRMPPIHVRPSVVVSWPTRYHQDYYCSSQFERSLSPYHHRCHSQHRAQSPLYPSSHLRMYKGQTPTIPGFIHPNPREFSQIKIALENILSDNATERFKFQILMDHLKL